MRHVPVIQLRTSRFMTTLPFSDNTARTSVRNRFASPCSGQGESPLSPSQDPEAHDATTGAGACRSMHEPDDMRRRPASHGRARHRDLPAAAEYNDGWRPSIVTSTTPRFSAPRCAKGRPCASNVSMSPEPVNVNSNAAPSCCVARCVVPARRNDASVHWLRRLTRIWSIAGIHASACKTLPRKAQRPRARQRPQTRARHRRLSFYRSALFAQVQLEHVYNDPIQSP